MNELQIFLNTAIKKRKFFRRVYAFILCMAVFVAFSVSIGLITPAESASGKMICGMAEHEHTVECYKLVCGYDGLADNIAGDGKIKVLSDENSESTNYTENGVEPTIAHIHSAECYKLICLTEPHIHIHDCYKLPADISAEEQTQLQNEMYELSSGVFGEVMRDEISILAERQSINEFKLYCTNGKAYYNNAFAVGSDVSVVSGINRTYNGTVYTQALQLSDTNKVVFTPTVNGSLILVFADNNYSGVTDGIKVVPVNENVPFTIQGNTKLIYAEFVRTARALYFNTDYYIKNVGNGGYLKATRTGTASGNLSIDNSTDRNISNNFQIINPTDEYSNSGKYYFQSYRFDNTYSSYLISVNTGALNGKLEMYRNQEVDDRDNANQRFTFSTFEDSTTLFFTGVGLNAGNNTYWNVRNDGTLYSELIYSNSIANSGKFIFVDPTAIPEPPAVTTATTTTTTTTITATTTTTVTQPAEPDTGIKIEARVIFGDYQDDYVSTGTAENHNYFGLANKFNFNLKRYGDNSLVDSHISEQVNAHFFTTPTTNLGTDGVWLNGAVSAAEFANLDNDEARKDWCYQYEYIWENVPATDNGNGYYIELAGVNQNNLITIAGNTYKVHYLKDTHFNHPGHINNVAVAPTEGYETNPQNVHFNESQIVYIFLELQKQGGTFDLSMKKRWDGHNSKGWDNRPKEKIRVQLQWLNNQNQWVRYTGQNSANGYDASFYYNVYDSSGNGYMVDKNKVGLTGDKIIYYSNGKYYKNRACTQEWIERNNYTYNTLLYNTAINPAKENRLIVKIPDVNQWNDIVLSVDGENHPQHFTLGYYYQWKDIPKGTYRIVETESFYDANDNNILDDGDRDTSSEYYYMGFPPQRNAKGVFHIQNFTKDMVIEVQKKWLDQTGQTELDSEKLTKTSITFELYRATENFTNEIDMSQLTSLGSFTTNNDGYAFLTNQNGTNGDGYFYNLSDLQTIDQSGNNYYYYLKEESTPGFILMNGNNDGFVWKEGGTDNDHEFGIDYEDGDHRRFIIRNRAKISLNVNKEWYDGINKTNYYSSSDDVIRPKFEVYKGSQIGQPVTDGNGGFIVNGSPLTRISATKNGTQYEEFTVDANGHFDIVSRSEDMDKSSYLSEQLTMDGTYTETYFRNGTIYGAVLEDKVNGGPVPRDNTVSSPFVFWYNGTNGNVANPNADNTFNLTTTQRFSVKPKEAEANGRLVLTFADTEYKLTIRRRTPNQISLYTNGDNLYSDEACTNLNISNPFKDSITISNNTITIEGLEMNGEYQFNVSSGTPKLISAKIYYADTSYYYIREVPVNNSAYILSNGNNNGFIETGENQYYTVIDDSTKNPVVTAKNEANDISLNITKNWQISSTDNTPANVDNVDTQFKLYRAFAKGIPESDGGSGFKITVGSVNYPLVYKRTESSSNGILSFTNLPAFESDNGTYKKCYYYIQEKSGNYTLLGDSDSDGFIQNKAGNYGSSFDETGSTPRSYAFVNIPDNLNLTINKQWLDTSGMPANNQNKPFSFQLYRKVQGGNSNLYNTYNNIINGITINNLEVCDTNGNLYEYYVEEVSVENYTPDYVNNSIKWNPTTSPDTITINNAPDPQGVELPMAGGNGTNIYILFGGGLALLSLTVLLFKKKLNLK